MRQIHCRESMTKELSLKERCNTIGYCVAGDRDLIAALNLIHLIRIGLTRTLWQLRELAVL